MSAVKTWVCIKKATFGGSTVNTFFTSCRETELHLENCCLQHARRALQGMNNPLRGRKGELLFADDAAVAFQISFCLTIKAPLLWHIMREKQGGVLYVPYVLMSKWTYLCQNAKRTTNSFACPLVYWFTHQLVNLFVRPAVNTPADVNYSVRNLTL